MPQLSNIVVHFSPELILAIGALVVLAYDLFVRGRDRAQGTLAVATVLLAMAATLWLYTVPPPDPVPVTVTTPGGLAVVCGNHSIFESRAPTSDGSLGAVVRCGAYVVDGFTQFFRIFGQLTALLVLLSGIRFMGRRTPFRGEFYAILLFATLAMSLMAGANDLVLIALAIEFLSISSYILTAYLRGDPLSSEAGLKYFLYGAVTSAAMLFGLSLLYGTAGSTSLPVLAALLEQPESVLVANVTAVAIPALMLVLAGLAFKIALVPFHQWSPDAYEGAPTPVTAFLSVGPKLAGFAVLLRLLMTAFSGSAYSDSWLPALTGLAVLTMVFGNIVALSQTNMKRMLAYSSIAQAGFMLVGIAAWVDAHPLSSDALASVLVYLLAYVFTNLGAFAVVIAVDDGLGSSEIQAYSGLMRRAPFLAIALVVFFLSLIGIPPLAGFIGKFSVFRAAIAADQTALALVGVLAGVVSVGYYLRVGRHMFFAPSDEDAPGFRVAPGLRLVIVVALIMTFVIGLYAEPFLVLASQAAQAIVPHAASLGTGIAGGG